MIRNDKFDDLVFLLAILSFAAGLFATYGCVNALRPMEEPPIERVETRVKIAVVDSGLQLSNKIRPYLCKSGHYSLVDSSPLTDDNPSKHGTNIAGLIAENLNPNRECLLIIKMIHPYLSQAEWDIYTAKAVNYAMRQKVKFVNLSFGGGGSSLHEFQTIEAAIKQGIRFAVSSGNNKKNLDQKCDFFPACYVEKLDSKYFRVVGSSTGDFGNTGKVVSYMEDGSNKGGPIPLNGTSQATAIHTGKWVRSLAK